jgi:sodium transport system permease protein
LLRSHIVKTVFRKELREMMRDRRSLAVMFGVPLVLYPLLTIALSTLGASKVQSLKETRYKVAVVNPAAAPELARRITLPDSGVEVIAEPDPAAALRGGKLDGVVAIPDAFEQQLVAGKDPALTLRFDRSRTEADFVERKLNKILLDYQEWVVTQRLKAYNAPATVTKSIERKTEDVSTAGQRMGNRLAQMLPLLVLITGMLGALFPALSATTTERELGTLETLLVTPAGRMELLLAKGLLVLLCGIMTGALNMISMSLVLWRTFSIIAPGEGLSLSLGTLVLTFVAAIPALVFFTALVLIVGLLARTFKEANSYATPAMLLPLASLALSIADVKATPGLLVTPIANTTLVMRDILRGRFFPLDFTLSFVSSLVYAGLLLSVAARLFSNEQLVNPAWEPLSTKGLRGGRSRGPRLPAVDEAIALFALSLLLLFYIQPSLAGLGLYAMLAITQLGLVFAPAALFAWLGKWDWRATFKLYGPRPATIVAGALLGVGLVPIVVLLSGLQQQFWPQSPEMQKLIKEMIEPSLKAHPIFTAALVGLLAGVFEELLFRGPIQSALMRKSRPWVAITIAAFLFAAAHLDLHGMPIRMLLGMILGWVVWRTGSIVPAMILHGLYDASYLGLVAWDLHHRAEGTPEPGLFSPTLLVMLATGAAMVVAGALIVRRRVRPVSAPGFEVVPGGGVVGTGGGRLQ